jgi:hypothetical protein
MQCRYCNTINEDGKFCKECGHKLEVSDSTPRQAAPDEHVKLGELIYASYKYKESGKLEDAALACQGALALNERSASAHALLGSVYELKGDIPAAIKEYEIVLSITPESIADRKILERLKSMKAERTSMQSSGIPRISDASGWKSMARPYMPFAAAFAGFFLVLAIGLASLHHTGGKASPQGGAASLQAPAQTNITQPGITQPVLTVPADAASGQGALAQPAVPVPGVTQQPAQAAAASAAQNTPVPMPAAAAIKSRGVPPVPVPRIPRSILPLTRETRPAKVRPAIVPSLPSILHKDASDSPVITPMDEPAPKQSHPSGSDIITPVITPDEPRERQSAPSPAITPVITPSPSRSTTWVPRGSPEQQAMQYQKAGQYREAISSWKQAMNSGSDSGRIQQQIGRCYQKLGRNSDAVESYKQAISIYKGQQADGRNPNDVQRNIRSCEAAIRISTP